MGMGKQVRNEELSRLCIGPEWEFLGEAPRFSGTFTQTGALEVLALGRG